MKLEDLLGEDLWKQVKEKIDEKNANEADKLKHIRYADLSEGEYVSKGKFTDLESEKTKLEEQIAARDATIEDLKKNSGADYKQKFEDLEKEKTRIESEYQQKLSDRDFNDMLREEIGKAKGKNAKAIAANLDIKTLKESKNQREDISNAIKALAEAEDTSFLFDEAKEPPKVKGKVTINQRVPAQNEEEVETLKDAIAEAYGN